jgi:hypothetical protein
VLAVDLLVDAPAYSFAIRYPAESLSTLVFEVFELYFGPDQVGDRGIQAQAKEQAATRESVVRHPQAARSQVRP